MFDLHKLIACINFRYSLENPKEHEAGYDSFLTGYCFLAILKYLKVSLVDFQPTKCKELNPFLNRIALQRIQHPFIYVTGKEPTFSRTHVFFVTFPPTWQTSDVTDHFKNYGPVHVCWVNNTSAFIALYNKENSSCVLKTIARPLGFDILSLAQYQDAESKRQRDASRKRKKEESESSTESSGSLPAKEDSKKVEKSKKKNKKSAKKAFIEGEEW